jgi:LysR family hydrogen peroxide-inducible transcriptional activator
MELQQLRYVIAIARTRSFSRAADQCHVSQPSLSQQIQKLEQELGQRLFTRLRRDVVPTVAGLALIDRASRILGEVEEAHREAADRTGDIRGVVHLGVLPTIAPHLLPQLMLRFREEYPLVEIIIQERMTTDLVALAATCEVDMVLLSLPMADDVRFTIEPLFSEDLLLAVPPQHRMADRKEVRLEEVEMDRFILQEGHCLGDQTLRFCDQSKCHPPVIFRTAQLETIKSLVAAGLGISLVPQMACRGRSTGPDTPVYVPMAKPRPSRTIAVMWRKELHHCRASLALLNVIRQTFKQEEENQPVQTDNNQSGNCEDHCQEEIMERSKPTLAVNGRRHP